MASELLGGMKLIISLLSVPAKAIVATGAKAFRKIREVILTQAPKLVSFSREQGKKMGQGVFSELTKLTDSLRGELNKMFEPAPQL